MICLGDDNDEPHGLPVATEGSAVNDRDSPRRKRLQRCYIFRPIFVIDDFEDYAFFGAVGQVAPEASCFPAFYFAGFDPDLGNPIAVVDGLIAAGRGSSSQI